MDHRNRWFTVKNGGSFHGKLLNNQMVIFSTVPPGKIVYFFCHIQWFLLNHLLISSICMIELYYLRHEARLASQTRWGFEGTIPRIWFRGTDGSKRFPRVFHPLREIPQSYSRRYAWVHRIYIIYIYIVNPGLINHGLLLRGYSSNRHTLILKWYPPN